MMNLFNSNNNIEQRTLQTALPAESKGTYLPDALVRTDRRPRSGPPCSIISFRPSSGVRRRPETRRVRHDAIGTRRNSGSGHWVKIRRAWQDSVRFVLLRPFDAFGCWKWIRLNEEVKR